MLEFLLDKAIASPLGPLRLRRETPEDEDFRFALFCEARPEFAMLPAAMRDTLLRQQFRAQTAGHTAQYPGTLFAIVEKDGSAIGRVALDETDSRLHLIDIAIATDQRGSGMGSAILRTLMDAAPVLTLHVARMNMGAARLYLRLGFAVTAENATYIEMEWRPAPR